MATMLIACNQTRESGSFMGDQLCSLKTAHLFIEQQPDIDRVFMSVSPGNEMAFLWTKFIEKYNIKLVYDDFDAGNWSQRHQAWDKWRTERVINGIPFAHYRELYLRIHSAQRQTVLCGSERGLGARNIYWCWLLGQENKPNQPNDISMDWFDDTLINHPQRQSTYDVYISPHAKTQGNFTFTFDFWADVVRRLVDDGVTVTVGYDGYFCPDLDTHPCFRRFWGDHQQWMEEVCKHKLVACGNTGTGWLAAACGVPMITMEPHNSCMADHRYRQCGLCNIIEVVDGFKLDELRYDMGQTAQYVSQRIIETVRRRVVMTTGCYDVLHIGHLEHLQIARSMGTKLIVALNSDESVRLQGKGPDRPINPQSHRKAVLEALRCVDEVRLFDDKDALPLIEELRPDVLACGYGYTPSSVVGKTLVESYGGTVAITCPQDARSALTDRPSTTKIVARSRQAGVNDALRAGAPFSVNPPDKLRLMAYELLSVAHLPGDVADLGTCKGGTGKILRMLMPQAKRLHLFDTWQGTPYDDPMCHHKTGEWQADLAECKSLIGDDDSTYYWQGEFPKCITDTLFQEWSRECQFCFVYIDMDTYQATKDALEFFWPRLVTGGKLLVDDYCWSACTGVQKACDQMFPGGSSGYDVRIVESQYTFIVTK